jgi:hypothetical protein
MIFNKLTSYSLVLSTIILTYYKHDIKTFINTYINSKNDMKIKVDCPSKNIKFIDTDSKINIYSIDNYYDEILQYLYNKYPSKFTNLVYEEEHINTYNEFRYRRQKNDQIIRRKIKPFECDIDIEYEYEDTIYKIKIDLSIVKDKELITKILCSLECTPYEEILKKCTITCENKEALFSFIETAKKEIKEEYEEYRKTTNDTMRVFYYKSDYWILLSKSPKRSIDTLYLKKGQKEKIISNVENFFSRDTRDVYLKYGIPYKSVYMIYGPPGSGKTSAIKSIASEMDCDLFVLPIVKDMLDNDLVSAFSYINDQGSKERIIVIEDVDTIFEDRKKGDDNNGITLQGFLNCLDGFTCIEGTMLFMTANKPEILDSAFIRSCRIDHKLKLDYADEYQTKKMVETFLPNQIEKFEVFYSKIRHKEYTTASLQELLFYNRDTDDLLNLLDEFNDIIENNDPKKFEIIKEENNNLYS